MKENTRKLLLYLQPIRTYWKRSEDSKAIVDSKIGIYPSSIAPRIDQGHYSLFDENGIPGSPDAQGQFVHHWTTICSYALANWEKFLVTGSPEYKEKVLTIARFMKDNVTMRGDVAIFLHYDDHTKESGQTCAMNQGEAISVLIRAHELTQDQEYLTLALSASKAYDFEYGEHGVTRNVPGTNNPWYLEVGKFILNGHIYACWGLWELARYTNSADVHKRFENGWRSVEASLPKFDKGWWSWYWLNEPLYIASIMYHNLHIIQLEHLGRITDSQVISAYAKKFDSYGRNPINRMRSGFALFSGKIRKRK